MDNEYYKLLKTEYKHKIYSKFLNAIKDYDLIKENDSIAVCVSGGKDSFLMAMCFKILSKHPNFPFSITYLLMDPGYSKTNLDNILKNAKKLDIPLIIFKTDIFKIAEANKDKRCYLCAKMRRGALYSEAQKLGCNKIALAHHLDDVNETLLLSILYSGEIGGMRPILDSTNFGGMKLIRPFYYVKEKDIISFSETSNISFLKSGCFVTKNRSLCSNSKRSKIKKMLKSLEDDKDTISKNILKSYHNVNLNKLNGYILGKEKKSV